MEPKALFLRFTDLAASEIETLFWLSRRLKRERAEGVRRHDLTGRHIALCAGSHLSSADVSVAFGVRELGGRVVTLSPDETALKHGESPYDFAAALSRYCHALIACGIPDTTLAQMVQGATIPVINAFSDGHHPCQALADFFTLRERFNNLKGLKIAYIGDGKSNIARSLIDASKFLGVEVRVVTPGGYLPDPDAAAGPTVITDFGEALKGVHAVYDARSAASHRTREIDWGNYKIDESVIALAHPEVVILCSFPLERPAISNPLGRAPQSLALAQAENRLHVQKALLLLLTEQVHNRRQPRERQPQAHAHPLTRELSGHGRPPLTQVSTPGKEATQPATTGVLSRPLGFPKISPTQSGTASTQAS